MFKLIDKGFSELFNCKFFLFEHSELQTRHFHFAAKGKNLEFHLSFLTPANSNKGHGHVLEHCVFLGSDKYSESDINDYFEANSHSQLNALTRNNYTNYYTISNSVESFYHQSDIILDMCLRPKLSKEGFKKEAVRLEFADPHNPDSDIEVKGIVYNEILNSIADYTQPSFLANKSIITDPAFKYFAGGEPIDLLDLSHSEILNFHKQHYHPSNAIVVSVGKELDVEKLQKMVNNHFTGFNYQTPANVKLDSPLTTDKNFYLNSDKEKDTLLYQAKNHLISNTFENYIITKVIASLVSIEHLDIYTFYKSIIFCVESTNRNANIDEVYNKVMEKLVDKQFTASKINKLIKEIKDHFSKYRSNSTHKDFVIELLDDLDNQRSYKQSLCLAEGMQIIEKLAENPTIITNFIKDNLINKTPLSFRCFANGNKTTNAEYLKAKIQNIQANLTADDKQEIIADFNAIQKRYVSTKLKDLIDGKEIKKASKQKKRFHKKIINLKGAKVRTYTDTKQEYKDTIEIKKLYGLKDLKQEDIKLLLLYKKIIAGCFGYSITPKERRTLNYFSLDFNWLKRPNKYPAVVANLTLETKVKNLDKVNAILEQLENIDFSKHKKIILKKINSLLNDFDDCLKNPNYTYDLLRFNANSRGLIRDHYEGNENILFIQQLKTDIRRTVGFAKLCDDLSTLHTKVMNSFNKCVVEITADSQENIEQAFNILQNDNIVNTRPLYPIKFAGTSKFDGLVSEQISTNFAMLTYDIVEHNFDKKDFANLMYFCLDYLNVNFANNYLRNITNAYTFDISYNENYNKFHIYAGRFNNINKMHQAMLQLKDWLSKQEHKDLDYFNRQIKLLKQSYKNNKSVMKDLEKLSAEKITDFIDEILLKSLENGIFTGVFNQQQYKKEKLDLKVLEFNKGKFYV